MGELAPDLQDLARKLSGPEARLLVIGMSPDTNEQTVEVAHEALIRNWPKLRSWLDEDRSLLALLDDNKSRSAGMGTERSRSKLSAPGQPAR